MPKYFISFDQAWVGDHDKAWFAERGVLAQAVVREMEAAGILVAAGGLDEDLSAAFGIDPTGVEVTVTDGLFRPRDDYLGGFTVVDVPDVETAKLWAVRIAQACGWPQELRRLFSFDDA